MPKKCVICKKPQSDWPTMYNSLQQCCSIECSIEKAKETNKKAEKKELKKRKEKLKSRSDWLKEAQTACNAYIRVRDKGQVCISCQKPAKKENAGHYRSVAAAPELRFHPWNISLQCEHCNSWKSGNAIDYRINLVKKIGLNAVEWLEGPQKAQKLTIEDIRDIKEYYKQLIKEIKQ